MTHTLQAPETLDTVGLRDHAAYLFAVWTSAAYTSVDATREAETAIVDSLCSLPQQAALVVALDLGYKATLLSTRSCNKLYTGLIAACLAHCKE